MFDLEKDRIIAKLCHGPVIFTVSIICRLFLPSLAIFMPTSRLSEFGLCKCFFHLFVGEGGGGEGFVEKSDIVGKPSNCKFFLSVNIDPFEDVCLLKGFIHNSSKYFR